MVPQHTGRQSLQRCSTWAGHLVAAGQAAVRLTRDQALHAPPAGGCWDALAWPGGKRVCRGAACLNGAVWSGVCCRLFGLRHDGAAEGRSAEGMSLQHAGKQGHADAAVTASQQRSSPCR